jgi:glucose-1-phosphate cytidylyltransferase
MKVVLLAGGLGTRLAEETEVKPKPMVEIGGRPILWHIMQSFAHQGFKEFFLALGYKGELIKRYFLDYYTLAGSMRLDMRTGEVQYHDKQVEDWLADGPFLLTYGDGVANVDLHELLACHRRHGLLATVTAVRPPARFGGLAFDGDKVTQFLEKPQIGEGWINGGFMVLEPGIFDYLDDDADSLETHALERLAEIGQLAAYRHPGFWQCMDTLRDKRLLNDLWQSGHAPWKLWV